MQSYESTFFHIKNISTKLKAHLKYELPTQVLPQIQLETIRLERGGSSAAAEPPQNKNCAPKLFTLGTIAGVGVHKVQWTHLALGELPW